MCDRCGHPFGPHKLLGHVTNERIGVPTSGWMECPEDDCDCYSTWSVSPELEAVVEATSD